MTDYLFSNMPDLFDSLKDETWFRIEKLLIHKSYNLKLLISVYSSGIYFLVIKCLTLNGENHIVASVLIKNPKTYIGKVDFSEHKIYFETKTIKDTETLLLERLMAIKLSSYLKIKWNAEKSLVKFDDKTILYNTKNSFITVMV